MVDADESQADDGYPEALVSGVWEGILNGSHYTISAAHTKKLLSGACG